MKQTIFKLSFLFIAATWFCACGNSQSKNDAARQSNDIQKMVKENSPGYQSTSAEYYFRAKINGKDWVADELMASDRTGRIIGKTESGESISLPFELRYTKTGATTNFKNHAVDIFMKDDVGIWGGRKGEMEFTKVGDKYAEGKFFVTANGNGTEKELTVTEGTFRIPITGE